VTLLGMSTTAEFIGEYAGGEHVFKVVTEGRVLYLAATSDAQAKGWVQTILDVRSPEKLKMHLRAAEAQESVLRELLDKSTTQSAAALHDTAAATLRADATVKDMQAAETAVRVAVAGMEGCIASLAQLCKHGECTKVVGGEVQGCERVAPPVPTRSNGPPSPFSPPPLSLSVRRSTRLQQKSATSFV
jgi:hypothetical protein